MKDKIKNYEFQDKSDFKNENDLEDKIKEYNKIKDRNKKSSFEENELKV